MSQSLAAVREIIEHIEEERKAVVQRYDVWLAEMRGIEVALGKGAPLKAIQLPPVPAGEPTMTHGRPLVDVLTEDEDRVNVTVQRKRGRPRKTEPDEDVRAETGVRATSSAHSAPPMPVRDSAFRNGDGGPSPVEIKRVQVARYLREHGSTPFEVLNSALKIQYLTQVITFGWFDKTASGVVSLTTMGADALRGK